jgi:hypothetical protein
MAQHVVLDSVLGQRDVERRVVLVEDVGILIGVGLPPMPGKAEREPDEGPDE